MRYLLTLTLLMTTVFLFGQSRKAFKKSIKAHRKAYMEDFLKEERSPIKNKKDLKYLKFYKAKRAYQVTASFERTPQASSFDMATYSGVTKKYVKYGIASFELNGKTYQLAIYQSTFLRKMEKYKDHLFLPFKDWTNGEKTYGGGRYIDLKMSDIQDGKVVLDFNKCYNPWCAFSDGYSCPIPPQENHLEVAIKAGEKNYGKKH
ncbi:MAG: DUF1684 domain-containing protein [Saprospiraceae bacterium]